MGNITTGIIKPAEELDSTVPFAMIAIGKK